MKEVHALHRTVCAVANINVGFLHQVWRAAPSMCQPVVDSCSAVLQCKEFERGRCSEYDHGQVVLESFCFEGFHYLEAMRVVHLQVEPEIAFYSLVQQGTAGSPARVGPAFGAPVQHQSQGGWTAPASSFLPLPTL
jgi:hypothetical protein